MERVTSVRLMKGRDTLEYTGEGMVATIAHTELASGTKQAGIPGQDTLGPVLQMRSQSSALPSVFDDNLLAYLFSAWSSDIRLISNLTISEKYTVHTTKFNLIDRVRDDGCDLGCITKFVT